MNAIHNVPIRKSYSNSTVKHSNCPSYRVVKDYAPPDKNIILKSELAVQVKHECSTYTAKGTTRKIKPY